MLTARQRASKDRPKYRCTGMSQLISLQRASAVTCGSRSGVRRGRAPRYPRPSSPLPHLRLPGKRLMWLEAALQPFPGAVPALPVVAESLQLLRALPRCRRHRRCPRLPPPSRAPRAAAGEAAGVPTLRGLRALPARRGHHGGGGCAAVSRGRYLSGGAAPRSSRPPPSAPSPVTTGTAGSVVSKTKSATGPKRLAVHSRLPPVKTARGLQQTAPSMVPFFRKGRKGNRAEVPENLAEVLENQSHQAS